MPLAHSESTSTASRLRSTGAERSLAIQSLRRSGVNRRDADEIVDEIDFGLGLDGRTLPDDVAPGVVARLAEHRAAPDEAATSTPVEPPAASAPSSRPTFVMPSEDPPAGTVPNAPGPRYVAAQPRADTGPADDATAEPAPLTARDRSRLIAEATKMGVRRTSKSAIADYLIKAGFSEGDANTAVSSIERELFTKRQAFNKQRSRAVMFAWLRIGAGVVMVILGLVVGRVLTLVLWSIIIWKGVERLNEAQAMSFEQYAKRSSI